MLPLDTLITFFGAAVLLSLSPGPDNVFVLLQSAQHGRRAGLRVVLGLCTGLIGHTLAVALGLAALFAASALAFTALKLAGAAYLLWLAWQVLRAPAGEFDPGSAPAPVDASQQRLMHQRLYRRGVLMNLSNPKVAIFFLALLPQFTRPALGPVAPQLVLLGAVFMLATLLTFGAIAWFAGTLGGALRRSARLRLGLNRVTGIVFIALAARLALAER
ncbi:MAG: LysE family translocator [Leptothrix sp. (in: b-proteobacteria)]